MTKSDALSGVETKARAIAEAAGYELVDVCIDREPTGKYLRFYIDKAEGVSLDDCEAFHKAIRALADTVDYDFMEVSSPGIDRPLKKDREFKEVKLNELLSREPLGIDYEESNKKVRLNQKSIRELRRIKKCQQRKKK